VSPPAAPEGRPGVVVECRTERANRPGPSWVRSPVPPRARAAALQGPGLTETLLADFSVRLLAGADRTVLVVCGELDVLTAAAFGGFLDVAASRAGHLVVIDFAGVTFIDASALGQLARILPRLRAVGSELAIVSPSPMAYKVLDLTGFTAEMHVEQPSRDGP
jgi:anti-anti-sigma factor